MRVRWFGAEILANAIRATVAAVDDTTADAVQHAKDSHPWHDETGRLEERITSLPAETQGEVVTGQWGVQRGAPYAIDLEFGTSKMAARPFLRPAADATYPELPGRIQRNLR